MKNNPLQTPTNTSLSFGELLNTDVTFFGKATYSNDQAAQEMIYKINAEAEQAQTTYLKTKTFKSAQEYLKWLQKAKEHFANEKQELLKRSHDSIQTTTDYKTVEANLQKVILEITTIETNIKEKLSASDLNESFTLVMEVIISKLEGDNKTINDPQQVSKTIQSQLKILQQQLPWDKISLSPENQQTLVTLILVKIAEHSESQVTSRAVKLAFRALKDEFLKTTIPASQFYWPGDFAIAPDGQIMELPDQRLTFYSSHGIRPLLLHREEFSKPDLTEKIKNYISELRTTGKNLHVAAADLLVKSFQETNNLDIFGNDKDIIENTPKDRLEKAKPQIANLIQQRLNDWINNPEVLLTPIKTRIEKSPSIDGATETVRQQMISAFSKQNSEYFPSYLTYLSNINGINIPGIAIFCMPTEPFLNKIEKRKDKMLPGGMANAKMNIIYLSGFKNIEIIPGLRTDLPLYPKPSVFGGMSSIEAMRFRDHKFQSSSSTHASQQTMIQESRDYVHSKIADKKGPLISNEALTEFNKAVDKTKAFAIRMEVLANKIIKGSPLERKDSRGLPDAVVNHSHYARSSIAKLTYVDEVVFNETLEWKTFRQCMQKDFANIKQEPRYTYVTNKVSPDRQFTVGEIVEFKDPLQKISVDAIIEEIGPIVDGKISIKLRLPDITELEKLYAYTLQELADNLIASVLDFYRSGYPAEQIPLEILGRVGEFVNKFKSYGYYALTFLKPYLDELSDTINGELVDQFFENAGDYLQKIMEQNAQPSSWWSLLR